MTEDKDMAASQQGVAESKEVLRYCTADAACRFWGGDEAMAAHLRAAHGREAGAGSRYVLAGRTPDVTFVGVGSTVEVDTRRDIVSRPHERRPGGERG